MRLELYTPEELSTIVKRSASILDVPITDDGALEIASRSRGTPRIANRLLKRVRDYAQVKGNGRITLDIAKSALTMLRIDEDGFDDFDRQYLRSIIYDFAGGPVGIESLAASLGHDRDTLENVVEPYIIQQGFVQRSRTGRIATDKAYKKFGLKIEKENS